MSTVRAGQHFARHVLTLLAGATLAQAIPVLASPVLTRLYSPSDFGVFAIFAATTAVLAVVANARYELAIMLPADEHEALNVAALSLIIAAAFSVFLLIVVIVFDNRLASALGDAAVGPWLYLAPISTFFFGAFNAGNYLASRRRKFGVISRANGFRALCGTAVQLALGSTGIGVGGLVIGQVVNAGSGTWRLFHQAGETRMRSVVSLPRIASVARRYSSFPRYSLWGALANALSSNMASLLLARFYQLAGLGQYSLTQRVLGAPVTLISQAVGQVFFQQAAHTRHSEGGSQLLFLRTAATLAVISAPTFTVAFFVVKPSFTFMFGAQWAEAGRLAQIMVPLFAIRFVVVPLSLMNQAYEHNRLGLFGNLSLLCVTIGSIAVGGFLDASIERVVSWMTAAQCLFYVLFAFLTYRSIPTDGVDPS